MGMTVMSMKEFWEDFGFTFHREVEQVSGLPCCAAPDGTWICPGCPEISDDHIDLLLKWVLPKILADFTKTHGVDSSQVGHKFFSDWATKIDSGMSSAQALFEVI